MRIIRAGVEGATVLTPVSFLLCNAAEAGEQRSDSVRQRAKRLLRCAPSRFLCAYESRVGPDGILQTQLALLAGAVELSV